MRVGEPIPDRAEVILEANPAAARRDYLAALEGFRQAKVAFFVGVGLSREPFFVIGDKVEHHDFGGALGVCARAHRAELYDDPAPILIASPVGEWIQVAKVYRSLRQEDVDNMFERANRDEEDEVD